MYCSSIGIGMGKGYVIWVWLGYLKILVTGMLYGFAIIIVTMLGVATVLGLRIILLYNSVCHIITCVCHMILV